MDILDARSLGGLNTEQLLTELNFLPAGDFRVEAKFGDGRADCFAPGGTAWLNGPLSTSSDPVSAY
jgi:hypothetical protein